MTNLKNIKPLQLAEFLLSIILLVFSVWYNLKLYRLEPTAKTDPNDNSFQFGLVDRANTVWTFADRTCPGGLFKLPCVTSYLIDHWVPNWAQGYNLPFYYSHVPQIVIVGSWRMLAGLFGGISLFAWYHLVIYLLLCFFPVSVFFGIKAARFSWLTAGAGAVLATHISTDGLYGLDPSSFLWRGYGLSSQLFAMIWLPLAIGFTYRYFFPVTKPDGLPEHPSYHDVIRQVVRELTISILPHSANRERLRSFWSAVVFTIFTTMGHLGIGVMALLSAAVIAVSAPVASILQQKRLHEVWPFLLENVIRLGYLGTSVIFFLSYWIIPTVLYNDYHNISFWDPIWKFNSYGWKDVLTKLFNGELFDWGRFPAYTLLVLTGAIAATGTIFPHLSASGEKNGQYADDRENVTRGNGWFAFTLLFAFWILMYFGRTTWGSLIDLIPGMTEFHLSRFLVGVHAIGLFLAPLTVTAIGSEVAFVIFRFFSTKRTVRFEQMPVYVPWVVTLLFLILVARPIYRQTEYYNELNDRLIVQGNGNYDKVAANVDALFAEIRKLPPARVFAGRGGGFGKDFKVAETPMYMYLSTYGVNTALWLPETWSMNSDTEQYFSEDQAKDYDLYNLKYVAAPPSVKPQQFWKKLAENPFFTLYEVPTTGYFTLGTRTQAVVTEKTDLINIVHLWIQSDAHKNLLFPQLAYKKSEVIPSVNVPVMKMLDEVTYETASGDRLNIFANNPFYSGDKPKAQLMGPEQVTADQVFKTTVKVNQGCTECYLILKETYHPNWRATVNGEPVKPITVFPFFIGIPLPKSGVYDVVVSYEPHPWKLPLLTLASLTAIGFVLSPWIVRKIKLDRGN